MSKPERQGKKTLKLHEEEALKESQRRTNPFLCDTRQCDYKALNYTVLEKSVLFGHTIDNNNNFIIIIIYYYYPYDVIKFITESHKCKYFKQMQKDELFQEQAVGVHIPYADQP